MSKLSDKINALLPDLEAAREAPGSASEEAALSHAIANLDWYLREAEISANKVAAEEAAAAWEKEQAALEAAPPAAEEAPAPAPKPKRVRKPRARKPKAVSASKSAAKK